MRLIDADALIAEYDRAHMGEPGKARQLMVNAPTIELRCEECEAFNKTRLLIPQPERTGKWLPDNRSYEIKFICSCCKESEVVPTTGFTRYEPIWKYCPNCGADMRGGNEDE